MDAPTDNCIFLLGSKTKLALMKPLTVPRLELNAVVLLAHWLGRLNLILAPQLNIIGIHAWSDPMIVLSWLNVPHESFKTYVSNSVHQSQTLTIIHLSVASYWFIKQPRRLRVTGCHAVSVSAFNFILERATDSLHRYVRVETNVVAGHRRRATRTQACNLHYFRRRCACRMVQFFFFVRSHD